MTARRAKAGVKPANTAKTPATKQKRGLTAKTTAKKGVAGVKPAAKPKFVAPKRKPQPKRPDRRGAPKGKSGQPPFLATPEQRKIVETHAAVGTQHEIIAEFLGISSDTLTRHFDPELRLGLAKINARIGANVAKKALEGSAKHEFFWLKTRGNYRTTENREHSGPGGAPIQLQITPNYDLSRLSLPELRALRKLSEKAKPLALEHLSAKDGGGGDG